MAVQKAKPVNQYLQDLEREIVLRYTPTKGWCEIESCHECEAAEQRIDAALDAAERAYSVVAYESQVDVRSMDKIYNDGLQEGRREGTELAHRWANDAATRAASAAKRHWYHRGLQEGRASAPQANPMQFELGPDRLKSLRKEFFEEALDDCHVIGESNPQMKPAANAIRHLIKKRLK